MQEGGEGGECTRCYISVPPTGAQVPITSYTCIQPNLVGFLNLGQCTVSNGLQYCETEPVPFY